MIWRTCQIVSNVLIQIVSNVQSPRKVFKGNSKIVYKRFRRKKKSNAYVKNQLNSSIDLSCHIPVCQLGKNFSELVTNT